MLNDCLVCEYMLIKFEAIQRFVLHPDVVDAIKVEFIYINQV